MWRDAIQPTVVLRPVFIVFSIVALLVLRPDSFPTGSLVEIWNQWDVAHYIGIATSGYGPPADPGRMAFLPLYPALIALGAPLADPIIVGMGISFLATLAAAGGLYVLVRFDAGAARARAAVLMLSIFPTAFALVVPYTEGLFLAMVVWSFVFARLGQWPAAGVCVALAAATRLPGILLLPALAIEYWYQRRRIDRGILWLLLGICGPLVYVVISFTTFGDPLFFLKAHQLVATNAPAPPWEVISSLIAGVIGVERGETWVMIYVAPLASIIALTVVALWTILSRASRPSYAVYTVLSLLMFASASWPISLPRFLIGVFPVYIAAGATIRWPALAVPLYVSSALLFGVVTTLFVMGHWAF